MNEYVQGTQLTLVGKWTNAAATPTDPTEITLSVKTPDGVKTSYTYAAAQITRVSQGVYSYDLNLNMGGDWFYRFEGSGACQAAAQSVIRVIGTRPV